jgi:hypothetical protein
MEYIFLFIYILIIEYPLRDSAQALCGTFLIKINKNSRYVLRILGGVWSDHCSQDLPLTNRDVQSIVSLASLRVRLRLVFPGACLCL